MTALKMWILAALVLMGVTEMPTPEGLSQGSPYLSVSNLTL